MIFFQLKETIINIQCILYIWNAHVACEPEEVMCINIRSVKRTE